MRGNCKVVIITCGDAAWTTSVVGGLMRRDGIHEVDNNSRCSAGIATQVHRYSLRRADHKEHENTEKSRGVNREHSTARYTIWNNSTRDDAWGRRDVVRQACNVSNLAEYFQVFAT